MIGAKSGLGVILPIAGAPERAAGLSYYTNQGIGSLEASGFDWGNWVNTLTQGGLNIAQAQFGQPNYAPGTYMQTTGPNGQQQIVYRQPTGSTDPVFSSANVTSSNAASAALRTPTGQLDMTTIVVIGVGLVVLMMMMQRR